MEERPNVSTAINTKHADPSNVVAFEHHPDPARQGQTVSADLLADAMAILRGEESTALGFVAHHPLAGKSYALLSPPELTPEVLEAAFPDQVVEDEEDDEPGARFNRWNHLERALEEVVYDIVSGSPIEWPNVKNPVYAHELRMAQRRTLEHLLSLAGAEVQA
jgi:hypothetical protein